MTDKKWYPILYMFLVTFFFSSIIIGFAQFTKQRVDANKKLFFEKAVLAVLPPSKAVAGSDMQMHGFYSDMVTEPEDPNDPNEPYLLRIDGQLTAYALPLSGQGFWAPIKGFIGIAPDKRTITGISFYEQNETPGLGAEIAQMPFRSKFPGKVITTDGKPITFQRPGEPLGPSDVHAVTGATQTSTRLEKIVDEALEKWRSRAAVKGE